MRVAVLSGGSSLEREVSLRSGRRVAEALLDRGHEIERLDLDTDLVPRLIEGSFDVAFLALHGQAGEDGTIQGLLDLLGVPYTGPDPTASALAWDKAVSKGLLRRAGIATPDWVALTADAVRGMGAARALDRLVDQLGCPLIVKPAQGGASMGVGVVDAADQLPQALMSAFHYHSAVLVERMIPGTEVAVSVLDGEPLPVVEIRPKVGSYDYAARYTHGATDFHVPARLPSEVGAACADAALAAWSEIGCRQITRVDLIVDDDGTPWVFELDTCPGLTETSLLPLAAKAAGIDFAELCERLVRTAAAG